MNSALSDVAAGDHARALARVAAVLDEGVERHDEEAAEQRDQQQVERDADPARRWRGTGRCRAARADAAPGAPTRKRSKANTVMPIEPSGTRPSSSLRPDSSSQSSEPMPMPTQNSARNKRHHVLARVQHVAAVGRQHREHHRAVEPEPRHARAPRGTPSATLRVSWIDLDGRPHRVRRRCAASGSAPARRGRGSSSRRRWRRRRS